VLEGVGGRECEVVDRHVCHVAPCQGGVISKSVIRYISWDLITPVIRLITFWADIMTGGPWRDSTNNLIRHAVVWFRFYGLLGFRVQGLGFCV